MRLAATNLRTAAAVDEAVQRHGVDRRLTKALLASEGALAALADVPAAEYSGRLDEVITALVRDNPALRVSGSTAPPRSGLPITGQGAATPQRISPRELRQLNLPAERVVELHRQGLIDTGGER